MVKLFFLHNISFFFFLNKSFFLIKSKFNYYNLNLLNYVYFKKDFSKNSLSLKFFNFSIFSYFISTMRSFIINSNFGYHNYINILGLGLEIKEYNSSLYRLFLSGSHFFYFFVPDNIIIKVNGNNFLVFSTNREELGNFVSNVTLLKKFDVYRTKGLKISSKIVFLKEGKKK